MRQTAVGIVLTSLLALAAPVQAVTVDVRLQAGAPGGTVFGYPLPAVQARGDFLFSDLLRGALNIVGGKLTAVGAGSSASTGDDFWSVTTPLSSALASVDSDRSELTLKEVAFAGGFALTTSGTLSSGARNGGATGGSLTLTNLTVDFTTKGVYADLTGANNVGERKKQLIWNYEILEGSLSSPLSYCIPHLGNLCLPPTYVHPATVSGLTITQASLDLFVQSLGLTARLGVPSFEAVGDYGALAITPVPEPSSAMLMALGMLGLAATGRRASHRRTNGSMH